MHFCGQDLDPDIEEIVAEQEAGGCARVWWFAPQSGGLGHHTTDTALGWTGTASGLLGEGGHSSPHYHNITFSLLFPCR